MVKLNRFGSVWDRNERIRQNDDKDTIERFLNEFGNRFQDLVAEGQLTPQQYSELIIIVNDLVKSGDIEAANKRIDQLVIQSGDANAEVTDAHVSTTRNKTFETIRQRFENLEQDAQAIERSTLKFNNAVINGDFSSGIDEWTPVNQTLTTSGGVLTAKVDGTTTVPLIRQAIIKENRKYYLKAMVRVNNSDVYTMVMGNNVGTSYLRLVFPEANKWHEIKGIWESGSGSASENLNILHRYQNNAPSTAEMNVQNVLAVDLTEMFGPGREPTETEFEEYLDMLGVSWFDGQIVMPQTELVNAYVEKAKDELNLKIDEITDREDDLARFIPDFEYYDKDDLMLIKGEEIEGELSDKNFKGYLGNIFDMSGSSPTQKVTYTDGLMDLTNFQWLEAAVNTENVRGIIAFRIVLYDDEGNSIQFGDSLAASKPPIHPFTDGLHRARVSLNAPISDVPNFNFSRVNRVNVRFSWDVEQEAIVYYVKALNTIPVISFNFDDGYASDLRNAYPILTSYGFKGALYLVTDWTENSSSMTKPEDMKIIYENGWDIGSHTASHIRTEDHNEQKIRQEYRDSRNKLREWGFYRAANTLSTPFGSFSILDHKFAYEYYDYIRAHSRIHNPLPGGTNPDFPFATYQGVDSWEINDIKAEIDRCIEYGSWWNMNFHEIPDDKVGWMEEIVSYVYDKTQTTDLEVLTPMEVLLQTKMSNLVDDTFSGARFLIDNRVKNYPLIK